jgi:hypothetical protein
MMLGDLYKWAIQGSSSQPNCWLHGPAGAGKSAIMQTLCQKLQDAGHLGGAFFFKRGHTTRGNAKGLFATLAYQLALNNRHLKPLISQSVEGDPSVVGRQMDVQLHELIAKPCKSLPDSASPVLLIDGLDECDTHRAQVEILCLIRSAVHQHPNTFRFLISSRPEVHIREVFEDPSFDGIFHSVNVEQSFADIQKYLRDEFARIHREHRDTMGSVPTPWPSPDILEMLVQKSSGYFVYASTVIKFVDDKYFRPTERLAAIQNITPTNSDAPFKALDQLYMQILSGVPVQFRSKLCDILYCVLFSWSRRKLTFLQIEHLLELQPGDVRLILRALHSVLGIPSDSDVISAHHASFLDFLKVPQRSSIFHIDLENHINIVRAILKLLPDDNHWLDTPDDPLAWYADLLSKRSFSPFLCRRPDGTDFISWITSLPPSAKLVPHIRLVNPDFLCWNNTSELKFVRRLPKVLTWLKVSPNVALHQSLRSFVTQETRPVPEDLIYRWECCHFMIVWEHSHRALCATLNGQGIFTQIFSLSPRTLRVLQTKMSGLSLASLAHCHQFVVQFPKFARILQARWLLHYYSFQLFYPLPNLYDLQLLLGLPWDDVLAALSALRPIIGGETRNQVVAGTITILALVLELYPANMPYLTNDLACGFLRLIQRIGANDISW